jgi:hypothetical protein
MNKITADDISPIINKTIKTSMSEKPSVWDLFFTLIYPS